MCCSRKRLARQQAAAALLASQMSQLQQKLPTPTPAALSNGCCSKGPNTSPIAHPQTEHFYTKCGKPRKSCCGRKAGWKCKKWCPGLEPQMIPQMPASHGPSFDVEQGTRGLDLNEKTGVMPAHPQMPTARPGIARDRPPSYRTVNPPAYSTTTPNPTATPALQRSSTFASRFLDAKTPLASEMSDDCPQDEMPYLAPRGGVALNGTPSTGTRPASSSGSSSSSSAGGVSDSFTDGGVVTPSSSCVVPNVGAPMSAGGYVPWFAVREGMYARKAVKWHRKRCVRSGCWCRGSGAEV